jgi:hypothetical protein
MSKFIDTLINYTREEKEEWTAIHSGIERDNVRITLYGNTAILSVIDVRINEILIPTTYIDRFRLEKTIGWWYENVSFDNLNKKQPTQ